MSEPVNFCDCPVHGIPMTQKWSTGFPGEPLEWVADYWCEPCRVTWRIKGQLDPPTVESKRPRCPTCGMNDHVTEQLFGEGGRAISWLCWRDGTLMRNCSGELLVVSPRSLGAAYGSGGAQTS